MKHLRYSWLALAILLVISAVIGCAGGTVRNESSYTFNRVSSTNQAIRDVRDAFYSSSHYYKYPKSYRIRVYSNEIEGLFKRKNFNIKYSDITSIKVTDTWQVIKAPERAVMQFFPAGWVARGMANPLVIIYTSDKQYSFMFNDEATARKFADGLRYLAE